MRGIRVLLAGVVLALLPAAANASSGNNGQFALRDIDCQGLTVVGKGLPAKAPLRLTLVNRDNGRVLLRSSVRTSASGTLSARMRAPMNQVLGMRVIVRNRKGTSLGFVDHTMARGAPMCQLPFTGPLRQAVAVGAGLSVVAGALLVLGTRGRNAYWPAATPPSSRI
jgi:hypothetical protein